MGKPIIRILYFQRRGIDANGYYRLNYIIQRGRKILYYATETKDFEYSDCFTSSCLAERKETILDTAQYIFKVHKVRYSRLILSPSYSYITKYKSRIRQLCTATRFCKSDIIWTMCPRSFIHILKSRSLQQTQPVDANRCFFIAPRKEQRFFLSCQLSK